MTPDHPQKITFGEMALFSAENGHLNVADVRLRDRQAICTAVKGVFDNFKTSSSKRFEDDLMAPEEHHKKTWLSNRKLRIRAASGAHPSRISAANDTRHIIIELGPGLNLARGTTA
jgi:hypothetical protein